MKSNILIVVSALALAACGGGNTNTSDSDATNDTVLMNDGGDQMNPPDANMTDNGMMANTAAAAPMDAKTFANTAAASDAFEIASAKAVQDKLKSADLKAFAAKMITDHSKSTADLKAAASFKPDATLNAKQTANLAALKAASADTVDDLYKTQQIPAHQEALAAMQGYAANGDDAKIKAFAAKTAPVVQSHLDMLQKM